MSNKETKKDTLSFLFGTSEIELVVALFVGLGSLLFIEEANDHVFMNFDAHPIIVTILSAIYLLPFILLFWLLLRPKKLKPVEKVLPLVFFYIVFMLLGVVMLRDGEVGEVGGAVASLSVLYSTVILILLVVRGMVSMWMLQSENKGSTERLVNYLSDYQYPVYQLLMSGVLVLPIMYWVSGNYESSPTIAYLSYVYGATVAAVIVKVANVVTRVFRKH